MIDSLHVAGFKLFRDIKLPRLGQLNLFIGENNCGKSCLLEAINLYAGRFPVVDLLQAASSRFGGSRLEPWDVDFTEEGTSLRHPIFDLFHWHDDSLDQGFTIEQIGDKNALRVKCLPIEKKVSRVPDVTLSPLARIPVRQKASKWPFPSFVETGKPLCSPDAGCRPSAEQLGMTKLQAMVL